MSTKSQTVTDPPTHTKSFWKAASYHAAEGAKGFLEKYTDLIIAAIHTSVAAIHAIATGIGVAAFHVGLGIAHVADTVSDATKDYADDISPTLKKASKEIGYHTVYLVPLVFAAAAGVAAVHYYPEKKPPTAAQPPMTTQFYKVSGATNDNCQLEEATPSANGKRVFELPKNCKFVPSELEAN